MIRTTEPAAYKVKATEDLSEIIEKSSSVLLTDFTGMSVANFDKLRLECFNNNILFRVAKNTIAKLAFERNGHNDMDEMLQGSTGFCIGFDDPILPVRILSAFIKETKKLEIKGCLVEGK
ncbi:MAG: 50S ribosomal protein L10, partial [Calditrichaeota bacterium]|nr:50S ribosomal protein L10 [Calditrichota bacterium]